MATVEMEPTELKPSPFMQTAFKLGKSLSVPSVWTNEFTDAEVTLKVNGLSVQENYLKDIAQSLREIRELLEEYTVVVE